MPYRILIFNQQPLAWFNAAEELLAAVRDVHFSTLCSQYGLNPASIKPAINQLAVERAEAGLVPYFLLRYQPKNKPPLVVSYFNQDETGYEIGLVSRAGEGLPGHLQTHLRGERSIYSVELVESQLSDVGLLLAYEVARWIASKGTGLVLGLDGSWYRLNQHHAFIPFI